MFFGFIYLEVINNYGSRCLMKCRFRNYDNIIEYIEGKDI